MRLTKILLSSAALAVLAAGAAQPALAQTAAIKVQAQVKDTAGGAVGTIKSVNGDTVILSTGTVEVAVPAASFTADGDSYLFGMTRAELEASVAAAKAEAAKLITVGATVRDTKGGTVGTIEAVDDQFVTIKLTNSAAKLPREAIGATPSGPVIGMTAAELEAAVSAANGQGK